VNGSGFMFREQGVSRRSEETHNCHGEQDRAAWRERKSRAWSGRPILKLETHRRKALAVQV
jgi:hypothetical protein